MQVIPNEYLELKKTALNELNKQQEHKIHLLWLFEFEQEIYEKYYLPEGKMYDAQVIASIKWSSALNQWQITNMTMIDCHADSIFKVYDIGEVIDVAEQNIMITKTYVYVVEHIEKPLLDDIEVYKSKPLRENLNILTCRNVDDDHAAWFWDGYEDDE
jgi:hypothetical protein